MEHCVLRLQRRKRVGRGRETPCWEPWPDSWLPGSDGLCFPFPGEPAVCHGKLRKQLSNEHCWPGHSALFFCSVQVSPLRHYWPSGQGHFCCWGGGSSEPCSMFSSLPGLYPLDARSKPPLLSSDNQTCFQKCLSVPRWVRGEERQGVKGRQQITPSDNPCSNQKAKEWGASLPREEKNKRM